MLMFFLLTYSAGEAAASYPRHLAYELMNYYLLFFVPRTGTAFQRVDSAESDLFTVCVCKPYVDVVY